MKKGFSIQDYLEKNKIELGSIKKEVGSSVYKGGHNDLRKTSYNVNIKDGKFQLDTHKTVLTEGVSYPSQDEAEALVDWTNHSNQVYLGGAGLVRKEFNKADEIRQKLWDKIFGDGSPWTVERKSNKLVVKWDKIKSEKLGI